MAIRPNPSQTGGVIAAHAAPVVGDFDNDGKLDVAVLMSFMGSGGPPPPLLRVLLGNGDGTFQPAYDSTLAILPYSLSTGDFNRDGSLDAATTDRNVNISVLLNGGGAGSPPDFLLSASPLAPGTVMTGQSATGTVSVARTGGFDSPISFACTVQPAPTNAPTCSINPSSSTSGTTLTVNTTGPASAKVSFSATTGLSCAIFLPLIGLTLLRAKVESRQETKRRLLGFLLCILLLAGLTSQSGCGAGTTGSSGGGTPAGAYAVTVTGASGSLQHSAKATLTVQ